MNRGFGVSFPVLVILIGVADMTLVDFTWVAPTRHHALGFIMLF